MALYESETPRVVVDKFNGDNFSLFKFKMEMILDEKDLWDIVEGTEKAPPIGSDEKVILAFKKRERMAFRILCTHLVDAQLQHVKSCKGAAEAWKTLCGIHETKGLANVLFLRRKFFTMKMQESDDLLQHINKVKTLADQLEALDVPVTEGDIVMTILESLPSSFENLIVAMETKDIKELTLAYVTSRLMHEVTRKKEHQNAAVDNAALVAQHKNASGGESSHARGEPLLCFNCSKPNHLARNCWKKKGNQREKAHKAKVEEDQAFVASHGDVESMRDDWIVDSGATTHMSPHRADFDTFESTSPRKVFMGDDSVLQAIGRGSILVDTKVGGCTKRIRFKDVLYVPKLQSNLLSVSKIVDKGLNVQIGALGCSIKALNGETQAIASRDGKLFRLRCKTVHRGDQAHVATSTNEGLILWHQRMGHLNVQSLKTLPSLVNGLDHSILHGDSLPSACEGCMMGKQHRQSFPKDGATRASKALEIVHSDVCGPMKTMSLGGARYFLTFIDDFSRKMWVYPLKAKSECFERFKEFKALVEKEVEAEIKVFRSDNGGEYTSNQFQAYLKAQGIVHQTSAPHTPQQNGVAERANRTIVEMARSMIYGQNLGLEFWAEAVSNAVYIRNRCPTSAVHGKTPQEAWCGKKPSVAHMRVFGCIAYAKIPDASRTKLEPKSVKCLFLGYCEGTKAYKLICLESKKIIRCCDVIFCEHGELQKELELSPSGSNMDKQVVILGTPPTSIDGEQIDREDESDGEDQPLVDEDGGAHEEHSDLENARASKEQPSKSKDGIKKSKEKRAAPTIGQVLGTQIVGGVRRSTRVSQPPGEWWKNHILPKDKDSYHANVAIVQDPTTVSEAMKSQDASKWEAAMEDEYHSLLANGTWELTTLPKGRKAVGCKWVFKTKRDAAGEIVRHKARLVARGFLQVQGVDFNETFAPVAKFTTIRCIVALGAALDLEMHQMDVKTAFLNGDLEEDIYMEQLNGFVQRGHEHLVCKLKKSLYGLKQASRAWYQKIDATLLDLGFERSVADHSLYFAQTGPCVMLVLVYVDDLIILSSNMESMAALKSKLEAEYEMTDLGELHYCLGVEFARDRGARTITMSQAKNVKEVLERFGMEDCKSIGTPLDTKVKLVKISDEEYDKDAPRMASVPYKSAVGSLMYAMVATRADLAFAISTVSQHMARPGWSHWMAIKRILRYLKGTLHLKLQLGGQNIKLTGYCDADWAGDVSERRSTTGYAFMLGDGVVSWSSKRQPTVALSTTEAEYMATSHCTREAMWLRQLLDDVRCKYDEGTLIMCDNQGAIALAKNPVYHARTKHIEVQHHFVREKVARGAIILEYYPTQEMLADVLTKALARERHEALTTKMGIGNFGHSQSGSVGSE